MQWQELRSHIRHLHALEITRIERAFTLGKKMHDGQKRRSGEPYFNHPIAVAFMLLDLEADADTIIAALLHDTVEDTPLTLAEIKREFGEAVSMLIDGVTKLSSGDVAMSPKLDEQIETLRKIFTLMQQDVRIMVIKIVDRLHNMQTVEFLPPERQKLLAKETIEVFVKIADKLCMQDMRDELESLCLAVLEPEIYPALLELRNLNEERGMNLMETMQQNLKTHDRILGSAIDCAFEHKTWDQMNVQRSGGGSVATGLSFITVAFVCDDIDACYRTLGALHQLWRREVLSFQDFINAPQLNGYRGIHTTIILQDGTRVRCKIRTKEMHRYARRGVTTMCFKGVTDIKKILPWTQSLSSLSTDTEGSSNDFWESLKSDILGESIVIHGPGDTTVQVPRGATALDGAFYLLKEEALKTKQIKVNGKDVPLSTPLINAASLDFVLASEETSNREWLRFVHTGLAAATIRAALTKMSDAEKLTIGREILQKVFTDRKRGFIEEFDERKLQTKLSLLGYSTLNDVYISIADGRVEPTQVYESLFESRSTKTVSAERPTKYTLRFSVSEDKQENLRRVMDIVQEFMKKSRSVQMHESNGLLYFSLMTKATDAQMKILEQELGDAGAIDIEWFVMTQRENLLLTTVILLWSLNPVLALEFLRQGVPPMTLITIRFLTIGLFMTAFFGLWRCVTRKKFAPIPHITLLALPSTLANAAMMIYLYALETVPPAVHLLILRFNTLLLPMLSEKKSSRLVRSMVLFGVVLLLTVSGIIMISGRGIIFGLTLSCGTLVFYTLYSVSTERTLQQHNIDVRYPYFLFHSGLISGALGLILLPWQPMSVLLSPVALAIVLYVICCVCITQLCYAALLKTVRFKHFTDLFLIEVPLAVLFGHLLLGVALPPAMYVIIAAAIAAILFIRWKTIG